MIRWRQYQSPAIFGAAGGGGGSYSAETTAWASAVTTAGGTVTTTQKGYVDTLVTALKSAEGITSLNQRFDRIVLLVTADNDAHQPAVDLVTAGTAWTFSTVGADTFASQWTNTGGYAGNPANQDYLDTGFVPSTAGGNLTQNSAHLLAASLTARTTGADKVIAGCSTSASSNTTYIEPYFTDNHSYIEINGSTFSNVAATSAKGVWCGNRTSTTSMGFYLNGAGVTGSPFTESSVALSAHSIYIGGFNSNGTPIKSTDDAIGLVCFGGALTSPSGVYTAIHNYMVSVGVTSPP